MSKKESFSEFLASGSGPPMGGGRGGWQGRGGGSRGGRGGGRGGGMAFKNAKKSFNADYTDVGFSYDKLNSERKYSKMEPSVAPFGPKDATSQQDKPHAPRHTPRLPHTPGTATPSKVRGLGFHTPVQSDSDTARSSGIKNKNKNKFKAGSSSVWGGGAAPLFVKAGELFKDGEVDVITQDEDKEIHVDKLPLSDPSAPQMSDLKDEMEIDVYRQPSPVPDDVVPSVPQAGGEDVANVTKFTESLSIHAQVDDFTIDQVDEEYTWNQNTSEDTFPVQSEEHLFFVDTAPTDDTAAPSFAPQYNTVSAPALGTTANADSDEEEIVFVPRTFGQPKPIALPLYGGAQASQPRPQSQTQYQPAKQVYQGSSRYQSWVEDASPASGPSQPSTYSPSPRLIPPTYSPPTNEGDERSAPQSSRAAKKAGKAAKRAARSERKKEKREARRSALDKAPRAPRFDSDIEWGSDGPPSEGDEMMSVDSEDDRARRQENEDILRDYMEGVKLGRKVAEEDDEEDDGVDIQALANWANKANAHVGGQEFDDDSVEEEQVKPVARKDRSRFIPEAPRAPRYDPEAWSEEEAEEEKYADLSAWANRVNAGEGLDDDNDIDMSQAPPQKKRSLRGGGVVAEDEDALYVSALDSWVNKAKDSGQVSDYESDFEPNQRPAEKLVKAKVIPDSSFADMARAQLPAHPKSPASSQPYSYQPQPPPELPLDSDTSVPFVEPEETVKEASARRLAEAIGKQVTEGWGDDEPAPAPTVALSQPQFQPASETVAASASEDLGWFVDTAGVEADAREGEGWLLEGAQPQPFEVDNHGWTTSAPPSRAVPALVKSDAEGWLGVESISAPQPFVQPQPEPEVVPDKQGWLAEKAEEDRSVSKAEDEEDLSSSASSVFDVAELEEHHRKQLFDGSNKWTDEAEGTRGSEEEENDNEDDDDEDEEEEDDDDEEGSDHESEDHGDDLDQTDWFIQAMEDALIGRDIDLDDSRGKSFFNPVGNDTFPDDFGLAPTKKSKKGKKLKGISMELQVQWEKDRAAKAEKKRQRELERQAEVLDLSSILGASSSRKAKGKKGKKLDKKTSKKIAQASVAHLVSGSAAEIADMFSDENMSDEEDDVEFDMEGLGQYDSSRKAQAARFSAGGKRRSRPESPLSLPQQFGRKKVPVSSDWTSLDWVDDLISNFLDDKKQEQITLPLMDKATRKKVHMLAECYGVKSTSRGSGKKKSIALNKTKRSGVNVKTQVRDRLLGAAPYSGGMFYKALHSKTSAGKPKVKSKDWGAGQSAKPMEGAEVGFGAEKIGNDNVGHKLLSMMGWAEGEKIGKAGGSGIDMPIVAVVKNTKRGLGG
ncbi:hypothetical protein IAR50_000473 [Cryptococcus sp. DSM 104548]